MIVGGPSRDGVVVRDTGRVQRSGGQRVPGVDDADAVGESEVRPSPVEGDRVLDLHGRTTTAESATALVWISDGLQVGCWIEGGDAAIFGALDRIRELREQFAVAELCADPWRAKQAMMELEREGLRCVGLPQTDVRLCPASQRLRQAVVDQELTVPDDPELARHAANAVQRHVRRGWRLEKPDCASPIDAVVSLAMALDRVEQRPEPVRVLGWV